MPSRPVAVVILLCWAASTIWLVQRDVLPSLGVGEITFERALAARAVEEPVEWTIYRGDEEVGSLLFLVKPAADGSCRLHSRGRIRSSLPGFREGPFEVVSEIDVDPLKRLQRLRVRLSLPADRTEVEVLGDANPNGRFALTARLLRDERDAMTPRKVELDVDPRMMVLDVFGQIDRLPDLRPGKTWTTQFVNPMRALAGGLLTPGASMDVVQNTVVDSEPIDWRGESALCYKVEHRHGPATTHSWARVKDGKVLVQEAYFAGERYRLVAQPPADAAGP